ncbi:LAME_0G13762g1_1 [Lachancea meyersii CBS 8951]|uniref:LAME_0G13762g1_1 n=1 Tax=Lachancea meyersii CBS 8951 TaxID=1266667 RepID=A0A1G4KA66_9SACH|nr:LAME_0G13762g1_1 [Lachancea meyersii CBS 8951]
MLENSIKVDDYFGNDDNGLWSWYLSNLRRGNFEELNNNELKVALLKRFLYEQLMSAAVPFNKKLLLVSIPDDIHENTNLLENFLRDYFHLDDLQYIQIRKLTQEKCYNHENHYLISDNLSNFNDKSFLELGAKNRATRNEILPRPQSYNNQYSIISGETGFDSVKSPSDVPSPQRELQPSTVILEDSCFDQAPFESVRSTTVEKAESVNSSECDDATDSNQCENYPSARNLENDTSSELVLQFKHHGIHNRPQRIAPELLKNSRGTQTANTSSTGMSSVRSADVSSYDGDVLTHTITRDEISASSLADNECISELSSVDHSLRSLSYDSDFSQGSSSMTSIFPSLSISEKFGRFRLVLQSILIQQPDTRQLFTAVRQSNNDPNVAHVNDDWLLYDNKFSMNNLQILALHDVLELNKFFPKVLFYTLVMIQDDVAIEAQGYHPNVSRLSPQPNVSASALSDRTLRLESTITSTITKMNSCMSSPSFGTSLSPFCGMSKDPYINEHDDEDALENDQNHRAQDSQIFQLYAATRTNSNKSTAHRSIRTIKSIGDWAFHHDSTPKQHASPPPSLSGSGQSNCNDTLLKTQSKSSIKSGLSKTISSASMSTVERAKTMPLPSILKTFSNFDDEAIHLRQKVAKFKRKRMAKRKTTDPKCSIM